MQKTYGMRDMTDSELHAIYTAEVCPNCGTSLLNFLAGPRGGMMRNVECSTCGAHYNICLHGVPIGQVIYEPIGYLQKFGFRTTEKSTKWTSFIFKVQRILHQVFGGKT